MSKSSIVINGTEILGNSTTVANSYLAINNALKELKDGDRDSLWIPISGLTNEGDRVVRMILLHRTSTVSVTIFDDGEIGDEFMENMAEAADKFFDKYGASKPHAEN